MQKAELQRLQSMVHWSLETVVEAAAQISLDLVQEIQIPKKSGKGTRTIVPPPEDLKELQRLFHRMFQSSYWNDIYLRDLELAEAVHGFVPGASPLTNAKRHLHSQEFFLCDFANAFGQVTTDRLRAILTDYFSRYPQYRELADLIVRYTTYKGAMPQGFPTSPVFLNMACLEMDRILIDFLGSIEITYTRYADDICCSGTSEKVLDCAVPVIQMEIEDHFKLAPHKHRRLSLRKGAVEVTGICILPPIQPGLPNRIGLAGHKLKKYRAVLDRCLRGEVDVEVADGILTWVWHVYDHLPSELQKPYEKLLRSGAMKC